MDEVIYEGLKLTRLLYNIIILCLKLVTANEQLDVVEEHGPVGVNHVADHVVHLVDYLINPQMQCYDVSI